ncbi:hypothetical protein GGI42DRAFT_321926 [Trichoderma sp. SZMC 28013]
MITETGFPSPDSNCCISSISTVVFIHKQLCIPDSEDAWIGRLVVSDCVSPFVDAAVDAIFSSWCLSLDPLSGKIQEESLPPFSTRIYFIPFSTIIYLVSTFVGIVSLHLHVPYLQTLSWGETLLSSFQPTATITHKLLIIFPQLHNMAFKLLKYLALLFVLVGLALAEYGAVSSEVMATAIHGQRGDSWTYHDNSSTLNASAHSSPSATKTSSFNMDRHRLTVGLTNIILQEPGFVLLSVSFVLISGGMVFL